MNSKKLKIEFGYDGKFDNNSENLNFQVTDDEDFLSGLNTFGYKRNIQSLFFEYDYSLNIVL